MNIYHSNNIDNVEFTRQCSDYAIKGLARLSHLFSEGSRKYTPCTQEIVHSLLGKDIPIKIWFMDGSSKHFNIHPQMTAEQLKYKIMAHLNMNANMITSQGFQLFEMELGPIKPYWLNYKEKLENFVKNNKKDIEKHGIVPAKLVNHIFHDGN